MSQSGETPEFLALYELDTDDIPAVQAALSAKIEEKRREDRTIIHDTCEVASISYYTFVSQVMKAPEPVAAH